MTVKQPEKTMSIANPDMPATMPWSEAAQRLGSADTYWIATVKPDGQPHLVPVLALWLDDALYFAAGDQTRKAQNLADNPHCVVTTNAEGVDLVVEGRAEKITDEAVLQRVAAAYADKYDWHVRVEDGALTGAEGAPSAGPPPYGVYEVQPELAFGFGTAEPGGATRWQFST